MISKKQLFLKRIFDFIVSLMGLFFLGFPLIILIVIASCSTQSFGIFTQTRVGQHGNLFVIYKIKTMRNSNVAVNSELGKLDSFGITLQNDKRLTKFGKFLRRSKLDEIPQLFNVFIGNMSIVGPRPDIIGYADNLKEEERIILMVKPGITGPATLAFKNEEELLSNTEDPVQYNNEVVYPQKVKLNIKYIRDWSFKKDLIYINQTIFN